MTTKTKRPARRQQLAKAARQAAQYTTTIEQLQDMRGRLQLGICPDAIPEGERRAAVVDLTRALAQLENLRRYYAL